MIMRIKNWMFDFQTRRMTKRTNKLLRSLANERKRRAKPITEDAAVAHNEIYDQIIDFLPSHTNLEKSVVYEGDNINGMGVINPNPLEDGRYEILIKPELARMGEDFPNFTEWRDYNHEKGIEGLTGRDYLKAVLAHEYGHIVRDQTAERGSLEDQEAYAFWFSDSVTKTLTPFKQFASYTNRLDVRRIVNRYIELHKRAREGEIEITSN